MSCSCHEDGSDSDIYTCRCYGNPMIKSKKWLEKAAKHVCERNTCPECGRVTNCKCSTPNRVETANACEFCREKTSKDEGTTKIASLVSELTKSAGHHSDLCKARAATNTDPSVKQKESGVYAKGTFKWKGLQIKIENPKGSYRAGTDKDGNDWKRRMAADYGYFKGTSASDGDEVDCFTGPNLGSEFVAVIDQYNGKRFDESKFILGTGNKDEAAKLYLKHYPADWSLGPVSSTTVHGLKDWLRNGDTMKPFKGQLVKAAGFLSPLAKALSHYKALASAQSIAPILRNADMDRRGFLGSLKAPAVSTVSEMEPVILKQLRGNLAYQAEALPQINPVRPLVLAGASSRRDFLKRLMIPLSDPGTAQVAKTAPSAAGLMSKVVFDMLPV